MLSIAPLYRSRCGDLRGNKLSSFTLYRICSGVLKAMKKREDLEKRVPQSRWQQWVSHPCRRQRIVLHTAPEAPLVIYKKGFAALTHAGNHRIVGWKRPLRSSSPTVNPTPPCLLHHIPKDYLNSVIVSRCPARCT